MTGHMIDETELVGSLSIADRCALAYFTASQTLKNALPSWESVPLLSETEYAALVERMRAISDDMREAAGPRGPQIWGSVQ